MRSLAIPGWGPGLQERLLAGIGTVGDFQLEHFGRLDPEELDEKSGHSDLVSWVDRESEARLAELLTQLYPAAGLVGEEGLTRPGEGEFRWMVDPLDGTTNYAYEHPFFSISVALLAGSEPRLGVVHAPRLGETFQAYAAGPALCGSAPLRVSRRRDPRHALFATGFADRRRVHARVNLGNFDRVLHATRGVRRAGSAALDLAFTAAGRLDGFWEMGLGPWDVAAGIFLVRAAGGSVSDFRGEADALSCRHIVASNGHLHAWLLQQLELDPVFSGPAGGL